MSDPTAPDTTAPATSLDLVPLCRMAIGFGEMLDVGTGPHGHRIVGEDESIAVTGERLAGQMAGRAAAGDERYGWLNGALGLARGLFRPGMAGLDYDVYEVRPVGSGASPGS